MKFKDKKVLEVDLKDYPKIKINNKIFEVKEWEWPYIDEDGTKGSTPTYFVENHDFVAESVQELCAYFMELYGCDTINYIE